MKKILKRIPVAVRVNAAIKSVRTKSLYRRWCKKYGSPSIMEGLGGLDWNRYFEWHVGAGVNLPPIRVPARCFFVSACWDQDRSGLVSGLQAHGEVEVFRGPDCRNELRMARHPGEVEACREANGIALEREFAAYARKGNVTALIGQMWNFCVPVATLLRIRNLGVPIINIAMDDRHSFHGSRLSDRSDGGVAGLMSAITLGATAAPECVAWYKHHGVPAVFFPEASDPFLYRPSNLPKVHDISFIGANYGFRSQVVAALRRAGLRVTTFGSGWPEGRIETEAMPEIFARSRIVLGIGGILHCTDFPALKMRDFDAPMSGSFYLAQANPDLAIFFKIGEEIDIWSNVPELIAKCRRYLADETLRERIARDGRKRVESEHTWNARFRFLLDHLGRLDRRDGG